MRLPDYQTAISAPPSPSLETASVADPLASISAQLPVDANPLTSDSWGHRRRMSALPPLHVRELVA